MPANARRMKVVHFLSRMFGIIYDSKPVDALSAVILLETISAEVASDGRDGLTPAVLARSHNLSPETARRRLKSLVVEGWLVQRNGQYFVPKDSPCWGNFDKIVSEFERLSHTALTN